MKKLTLYKAALDFAFSTIEETNAIALAEKSIAAYKAGGFDAEDLAFWNQVSAQGRQQFSQLKNQKLQSEITAAQTERNKPADAPAPTETAAT